MKKKNKQEGVNKSGEIKDISKENIEKIIVEKQMTILQLLGDRDDYYLISVFSVINKPEEAKVLLDGIIIDQVIYDEIMKNVEIIFKLSLKFNSNN